MVGENWKVSDYYRKTKIWVASSIFCRSAHFEGCQNQISNWGLQLGKSHRICPMCPGIPQIVPQSRDSRMGEWFYFASCLLLGGGCFEVPEVWNMYGHALNLPFRFTFPGREKKWFDRIRFIDHHSAIVFKDYITDQIWEISQCEQQMKNLKVFQIQTIHICQRQVRDYF